MDFASNKSGFYFKAFGGSNGKVPTKPHPHRGEDILLDFRNEIINKSAIRRGGGDGILPPLESSLGSSRS